jgi:hypothetical protein
MVELPKTHILDLSVEYRILYSMTLLIYLILSATKHREVIWRT